jgi:hypothetical protein
MSSCARGRPISGDVDEGAVTPAYFARLIFKLIKDDIQDFSVPVLRRSISGASLASPTTRSYAPVDRDNFA